MPAPHSSLDGGAKVLAAPPGSSSVPVSVHVQPAEGHGLGAIGVGGLLAPGARVRVRACGGGGAPGARVLGLLPPALRACVPWTASVVAGAAAAGTAAGTAAALAPSGVPPLLLDPSDQRAVGRWGEALVYQYLLLASGAALGVGGAGGGGGGGGGSGQGSVDVEWANERGESRAFYDIKLTPRQGRGGGSLGGGGAPMLSRTVYVEVKATASLSKNVFELSLQEWEFASKPGVRFDVYRVFGAGDPQRARIVVVEDVARALREQRAQLCLAIQDPR